MVDKIWEITEIIFLNWIVYSAKNSNTTSDVILQCSISFDHDEFTSRCLLQVKVKVKFSLN